MASGLPGKEDDGKIAIDSPKYGRSQKSNLKLHQLQVDSFRTSEFCVLSAVVSSLFQHSFCSISRVAFEV